jgi:3alpha(or 20beta)-hydroxysteroid dehydrogenase
LETGSAGGKPLAGKVIMITGGASGIGAGIGRLFSERGAAAILCDLAASSSVQELDVTREDAWVSAVGAVLARYKRIHGLVNCAGILISRTLVDFELRDFKRVIDVNLKGAFLGIKHTARAIAAAGGGSIVNVSSTEGLQGANSMAAYASSKWALRGLTRVAAIELGSSKIRVNSVHPGPIDTPMLNPHGKSSEELRRLSMFERMPISRVGDVADVAELCAFLVSDASAFISGAEIPVDGGLTASNFIPGRPGAPASALEG